MLAATDELLQRANVQLELHGPVDQLQEHRGGLLLVGNHKNQWEFVAAASMLHRIGRSDMLNIAKFSVQRQVFQAVGGSALKHSLPVYPRLLASDRGEFFNYETFNRIMYRKFLLSTKESERKNNDAISCSSDHLAGGGVVNIYPCGSIVDASTNPWRPGIGRIIARENKAAQSNTLVVPYELDEIHRYKFLAAVVLGRPLKKPMTLPLHIAEPRLASRFAVGVYGDGDTAADRITASVRDYFLQTLYEQ